MSLESMLRTSCTWQRKTTSKDAAGGMVNTFSAVSGYSDIPCDIQPASSNTRMRYMQEQLNVSHTIYFAQAVPANAGDRFTSDGRTFLFQGRRPSAPGYVQWAEMCDVQEQL